MTRENNITEEDFWPRGKGFAKNQILKTARIAYGLAGLVVVGGAWVAQETADWWVAFSDTTISVGNPFLSPVIGNSLNVGSPALFFGASAALFAGLSAASYVPKKITDTGFWGRGKEAFGVALEQRSLSGIMTGVAAVLAATGHPFSAVPPAVLAGVSYVKSRQNIAEGLEQVDWNRVSDILPERGSPRKRQTEIQELKR